MKYGLFLFGSVEMADVRGGSPISAAQRRYDGKAVWQATEGCLDLGITAEELGFDSYWLAEHHFQHEGYEVIPNSMMLSSYLAAHTKRITMGSMFNIVPQWHPLRIAEDFSTLLNLSKGRAMLGVGRGTVPLELQSLGMHQVTAGYLDGDVVSGTSADDHNREVFAEYMEVIRHALTQERFAYDGKFLQLPPPQTYAIGGVAEDLTLVPSPLYPVQIWQAVTSPPTLNYVADVGHGAVWWNQHHTFVKRSWEKYGQIAEENGRSLTPGQDRLLVLPIKIGDTHEQAWAEGRPGHDEFWNLLGPFGWSRGYMGDDGKPAAPGLIPTLEQSAQQRTWAIGTAEEVAEMVHFHKDALGLEELVIFPHFPGDTYRQSEEQMHRFVEEVLPLVN